MVVVKGRVVDVGDYFEFKVGSRAKADYCPITIRCENGDLVRISMNTHTMMQKTYMVNNKTGELIQVGMVKPKIGDWLEVEGTIYESYDGIHAKTIRYVRRITRTVIHSR